MKDTRAGAKEILAAAAVIAVVGSVALALSTVREGAEAPPVAAVNAANVIALTNEERADRELPVLARNTLLDLAARLKAEDMAAKGYYAHVAPDGTTPMDFVNRAGYRYRIIGENLVVQRTSAEQVVDAFMDSSGHRANILRKDFTEIGVGTAEGTYKGKDAIFTVQIFAAPLVPVQNPKENVKPTSNIPKVAELPKTPIVATVPRPETDQKPRVAPPAVATTSLSIAPLDEKVKEILKPLTEPLQATTTASSTLEASSTPSYAPSFPLKVSASPVFEEVSRLETGTSPKLEGSTWTELSLWVGKVFSDVELFLRRFES